jgi:hypothetical protein
MLFWLYRQLELKKRTGAFQESVAFQKNGRIDV